ncbi:hypothetical protein [Thalassotalea atypica]|uniref:hypothetical protein n=1 Tax=Thalassotalea atypica TaxID=2054316 RepID=UPI002573E840|nr:hypothetical protein [Thalassotalea atypica]
MLSADKLASQVIVLLQAHIKHLGFSPVIHFELEGCCQFPHHLPDSSINFDSINAKLNHHHIEATLVPEYWQHQWEYVSNFAGQTPLKEAQNLAFAINKLPVWFAEQGVYDTLIKPVVWSGDEGKLALGSKNIFTPESRAVHIPNAVQINVSALNADGENIISDQYFGEYLQQCFINTSLACCLLYLPEPEAYERLVLKTKYGLTDELCSPSDISGGHQGSIALYKKQGKHNQPMGVEALILDQFQQTLVEQQNWQKTARIEHRLGASSRQYNPFFNVIFALANVLDALEIYLEGKCYQRLNVVQANESLPSKMSDDTSGFDALSLFEQSNWLSHRVNRSAAIMCAVDEEYINCGDLGNILKHTIINTLLPNNKLHEKLL